MERKTKKLIAGAFGVLALGMTAMPAVAETYYYDAPPTTERTTTTTTYTETEPSRTYIYEHEDRDRDRHHGAGIHLDTPILNFGIGVH